MNEELLEQIHVALGWKPQATDEHSVTDLNAFPDALVEAARLLPPVLRYTFVNFYASTDDLHFVPDFVEEVIEHGRNAAGWRRGRVLVPDFLPRFLVQLEADEIIAPLAPTASEDWYQLKPRLDLWKAGEFLTGAPAVIRPNLSYKYFPPEHVRDLLVEGTELNRVVDLKVAVRRWTASSLGIAAMRRDLLGVRDATELLRACFPDASRISTNGFIAARGLIRELDSLAGNQDQVPGFRGPDSWYQ